MLVRLLKEVRSMTEIPTYRIREYLNHCEQAGGRKLLLGALPRIAQEKMRHILETYWKGDHCYTVAESLSNLCAVVNVEHKACKQWT